MRIKGKRAGKCFDGGDFVLKSIEVEIECSFLELAKQLTPQEVECLRSYKLEETMQNGHSQEEDTKPQEPCKEHEWNESYTSGLDNNADLKRSNCKKCGMIMVIPNLTQKCPVCNGTKKNLWDEPCSCNPTQKPIEIKEINDIDFLSNLPKEFNAYIIMTVRLKDKLNELIRAWNGRTER